MATKRSGLSKKRAEKSGRSGKNNWLRAMALMIVAVAFILGAIYAGGCGSNNQNPENGITGGSSKHQQAGESAGTEKSAGQNTVVEQNKQSGGSQPASGSGSSTPAKKTNSAPGAPGKLAIIIDDCGYSTAALNTLAQIDCPLTFSVIPYLPASNTAISKANASGKQIMVHLPMQSASGASAEKITIMTTMSDAEIQRITRNAINAIPGAVGLNNHQGSKATADVRVMRAVMSVIAADGLFYVDSMTNPATVGCDVAREFSVATSENEIFLDNSDSVSYIKGRIAKAMDMARNKTIIAIGHARPNTARALSEMAEEIQQSGIQLIFASQAVR